MQSGTPRLVLERSALRGPGWPGAQAGSARRGPAGSARPARSAQSTEAEPVFPTGPSKVPGLILIGPDRVMCPSSSWPHG